VARRKRDYGTITVLDMNVKDEHGEPDSKVVTLTHPDMVVPVDGRYLVRYQAEPDPPPEPLRWRWVRWWTRTPAGGSGG
jgi:hypothetical protein